MFKRSVVICVLSLLVAASAHGGLIPNGDFETGDFTDWNPAAGGTPGNGGVQTVEFIDGSYRAVIKTAVAEGPGGSAGELLTSSNPLNWGNGKILQFDLSYEYAINSIGGTVAIAVELGTSTLVILNLSQQDLTPLSGSSSTATYSMPWDGSNAAFDLFPTINAQDPGSVSLTVILDNVRIIPEPSTIALFATALVATPFVLVRRVRRRSR
jgi:hypothetical protein